MAEGGPTQIMRSEHKMIRACMEEIHRKVDTQDPESDADEQRLLELLKAHNMKEERILYPSMDQVISDEDRAKLYRAMKEMSKDRYRASGDD
jgi:hemerythrin-like domain-containing protein